MGRHKSSVGSPHDNSPAVIALDLRQKLEIMSMEFLAQV